MSDASTVDWRGYYDREGETKRFLPEHDPAEAMRVEFVTRLLGDLRVESALDVGCGNGYLASKLRARPIPRVAGVDFSRPRLKDGSERFRGIRFSRASGTALPFADRSFDLVTMVEVLEHIPDTRAALAELARVARGHVLVTVPYRGKIVELVCPHCLKSYFHDGHIHSFDEERIAAEARAAGLTPLRVESYTPYYPSRNPVLGRLPHAVHRGLRKVFVATGLLEAASPKYLGVLAAV